MSLTGLQAPSRAHSGHRLLTSGPGQICQWSPEKGTGFRVKGFRFRVKGFRFKV